MIEIIVRKLIESRLSESKDENGKTIRGETTLRNVLVSIADELNLDRYDRDTQYELHHLNGRHSDHSLSNLTLLPKDIHSEFNRRLGGRRIKGYDQKAINLFNEEYEQYCVYVGKALENLIKGL